MFFLPAFAMSMNDPQWGRSGASGNGKDDAERKPPRAHQDGPPDLDELWRDFNRKLNNLFGRRGGGSSGGGRNGGGGFHPDARGAGVGVLVVLGAALLIWFGSGFYIVPEGQVGVVTTFGRYSESTTPGFRWRLPWPIQAHEMVDVFSVRTVEIGARGKTDRLKEALMLTDDENIVDIHFTVQFRLKEGGARDFLFNHRFANSSEPRETVIQVAESAMREVVGRKAMDSVLYESRQEIADAVRGRMQEMLDRYGTGILISAVAIQNAQPPEPVQAAFDDAVKAGQDRERQKNEGQAYANDVIPRARGAASRLFQEADGYKQRVIANAEGDASRFKQVLTEYAKAPQVTRERIYIDTMREILSSTNKIMMDYRGAGNLLMLPLEKLMQQAGGAVNPTEAQASQRPSTEPPAAEAGPRSRETLRNRERVDR